jgi:hypothetical protein
MPKQEMKSEEMKDEENEKAKATRRKWMLRVIWGAIVCSVGVRFVVLIGEATAFCLHSIEGS